MKDNPYEDATTEKDAYAEFLKTLRREPTEQTEAMKNGIIFEDLVTAILENKQTFGFTVEIFEGEELPHDPLAITEHKWYEAALTVANKIRGGVLQYKAYKTIDIAGTTVFLYGRLDALRAGTIYDIKFSKSYERGKYFSSTQHPTYFEVVPEAKQFQYLVSNGADVWTETYSREDSQDIKIIISDFFSWLSAQGLMELYKEKWLAR
jgi:hypothetical protein